MAEKQEKEPTPVEKWKRAFAKAREEFLDTLAYIRWAGTHHELYLFLRRMEDC